MTTDQPTPADDHDGHEVKCGPDCPARYESLLDLVSDDDPRDEVWQIATAYTDLQASFRRVVRERDSLARRCAVRYEETVHAQAERDAAQSLLVEEQRGHAATRAELAERKDQAVMAGLEAEKFAELADAIVGRAWRAEATVTRQRPVIEAARAWRDWHGTWSETVINGMWQNVLTREEKALAVAVDALGPADTAQPAGRGEETN
jgi:hypothetical protein